MQTFTRWFAQDLKKPILIQYGGIAFMGDDGTPEVGVHVTVDGAPAALGGSAGATVIRPDGATVPVTTGVVSGGDVSVKLTEACFAVPGRIAVALTIDDGTTTMTVLKAVFTVEIASTDTIIDPSGEVALDVAALVAAINTAVASVPSSYTDLLAAVAPDFSDAAPWTAGQHVWYDGQLYQFLEDHPAGTWIGTDAEQMPIFTGVERVAAQVELISDQTANLWYNGDIALSDSETYQQFLMKNPLPAGTYTLSMVATASATSPANSKVMFSKLKTPGALPSSSFIATVNLAHDGERHDASFTLEEPAYCVRFLGGTAVSGSNSVTGATFEAIQIEAGDTASGYVQPMTAVDHAARAGVAGLVSEQAGNMRFKRYLDTGEDLDDFVDAFGMYVWIANKAPEHMPTGMTGAGVLLAFGADLTAFPIQIVVENSRDNNSWYRYYRASAWTPWHMLATHPHIEVGAYITPDCYISSTGHAPLINQALADHGFCRLGPGEYIIKEPIVMPAGSMLLGCGETVLRLTSTAATINVVEMAAHCTVRDVTLAGLSSGYLVPSDTIGGRVGIAWDDIETTPTPSEETDERKKEHNAQSVISGVTITDFDGAGILLRDTDVPVDKGIMISDCFIHRNTVGIYIQRDSEFHKIANSTITWNGWGILNRGGNNIITGCGIDKNLVGIQIDNDEGSNNGHGNISNCTINHSGANNDGYGLIVRGTGREMVTGCNFYYSDILLEGTNGNVITGCGFGQAASIEISGGGCSIFNACMFRDATNKIVLRNNSAAKIINCYTRTGADATVETAAAGE